MNCAPDIAKSSPLLAVRPGTSPAQHLTSLPSLNTNKLFRFCISAAPAALDHYLAAVPAISLIPVAPFRFQRPVLPRFLLPNFYFFCALCIHGKFAITFLSETSAKERKYGHVYQSSKVYRSRHSQRQGHDQARRRRDRRGRENGHQSHRFILDDGRVRRRAPARRAR